MSTTRRLSITDQRFYIAQYWNKCEFLTFQEYFENESENLIFFLRDEAERQWEHLSSRMEGASDEEIGVEMKRWWDRQLRRFRDRLRYEKSLEKMDRFKERLFRTRRLLRDTERQLHQAKDDLKIESGLMSNLKEQQRCRNCKEPIWDSYNQ